MNLSIYWFITYINAINIILSTTDTWVTKNIRLLYDDLKSANHNVLVVAPLYQGVPNTHVVDVGIDGCVGESKQKGLQKGSQASQASQQVFRQHQCQINDGGDFSYLLPSNQLYYKNLQKLSLPRLARNVINPKLLEQFKSTFNVLKINNTVDFGNDPLNNNFWYVNSANPVNVLSVFIDNIMPTYYRQFQPDLVIFGPVEGLLNPKVSSQIAKYLSYKDIPSFIVDTVDKEHISYQDDILNRANDIKTIASRINNEIITVIERLAKQQVTDGSVRLLPHNHVVNLNFPSFRHPNCFGYTKVTPIKFTRFQQLFDLCYHLFTLTHNKLVHTSQINQSLTTKHQDPNQSLLDSRHAEKVLLNQNSNLYKQQMVLRRLVSSSTSSTCNILLSIYYLYELDDTFNYDILQNSD